MPDFAPKPTTSNPRVQLGINPAGSKTGLSRPLTLDYSDPSVPISTRLQRNIDREPGNIVTKTLDLLSRGQYASAAFTDTLLSQGFSNINLAIGSGVLEFFDPKARLSYEDLIERYNPEFAKNNPKATFILGLAGDIVLDPTSYIGLGLFGKAKKVGGIALNEVGQKVFTEVLQSEAKRVAIEFGKDTADDLVRKSSALFFRSNEALTVDRSANAIMANILKDSGYASSKLQQLGLDSFIGEKLTQEKGLRLFVGLGSKEAELPIYKVINPIFEASGINKVVDKLDDVGSFISGKIGSTKIGKVTLDVKDKIGQKIEDSKYGLRSLFIVDEEVKRDFKFYENFLPNVGEGLLRDIAQIPKITDVKDFENISKSLLEIESLQKNTKNIRGFFDIDEMATITSSVFKKYNLSNEEIIVANSLQQRLNDIKFVEYGVDLLKDRVLSFDQGANTLVKNADDFIRFKQSMLDGTLGEFVATSKELQDRIFSLDTIRDAIGKTKLDSLGKDIVYGKAIKNLDESKIFNKIKPNTITKINEAIIEGTTSPYGLETIENNLIQQGFEKVDLVLDEIKNPGVITDDTGKIFKQSLFKAKDGSIVRLVNEETGRFIKKFGPSKSNDLTKFLGSKIGNVLEKETKFTLIKSVSAPNEEFVRKFVGEGKKEALTLNTLKNAGNVIDGVQVDAFGSVAESIYRGDELKRTYDEMVALGNDPNVNALLLYTQRAMKAQKEMGEEVFKKGLLLAYGKENLKDLPRNVQERLKYVGEGLYSSGLGEGQKLVLKTADFLTSVFKKTATIANPSFGIKQIVQNPIQASLQMGLSAFKVFDPRALIEAGTIVFADNTGFGKNIPDFVSNLFYKNSADKAFAAQAVEILSKKNDLDYISNMVITNPMGRKYNGQELLDAAYKLGIFKGSIGDLDVFERDIMKEIGQGVGSDKPGVLGFAKNILKYWNYPEHIEKFYRMSYFINGFRNGLDLEDSASLVNKTLFDYQGSLTQFERRVVKRLIPFFSFQRNAIPLIISSALQEPGKVATINKVFQQKFFDVWEKLQGGQELTDQERYITPDFILQQPSAFAGTDEKGNLTFQTFNNYTPFDAINLIEFDQKGDFDFNKTLKKIVLSSINPYLKMSTEVPLNRYFFSDRVITEANKVGGGVGRLLDAIAPDEVKNLIDFEKANDPVTGELKYYVNPYIAYASMSFPGSTVLNNFLNIGNPDEDYKQKTMDLFFGIKTYKYNKEGLEYTYFLKTKYEINELKGKYKQAIKQGRLNEAEVRLKQLQDFMEFTAAEQNYQSPPKPSGLE